jgi:hypothetical protein
MLLKFHNRGSLTAAWQFHFPAILICNEAYFTYKVRNYFFNRGLYHNRYLCIVRDDHNSGRRLDNRRTICDTYRGDKKTQFCRKIGDIILKDTKRGLKKQVHKECPRPQKKMAATCIGSLWFIQSVTWSLNTTRENMVQTTKGPCQWLVHYITLTLDTIHLIYTMFRWLYLLLFSG